MEVFDWPLAGAFLDRHAELARLEEWWESDERMPVNLYGRRRVGKSWLFRRFAHGKPAVLLVADRLVPGAQLDRFASALEPLLGIRPDLPDVPSLFRVLFRAARASKVLVVIDELPWLLPPTGAQLERELSAIQAVMEEERDASSLKLILCGSAVAQMEALMSERNPLHGRLVPLRLMPLPYAEATVFLDRLAPLQRIERFAITGGMPRYLAELGHGPAKTVVCSRVLDRNGPLWDEGRAVLAQELRQPSVYFSVLAQLGASRKDVDAIAGGARVENATVSRYLTALADLGIVRRTTPVGAAPTGRAGRWELIDPFLRFWFRFVFPYQAELESGLAPADLWDSTIAGALGQHVAPIFEDLCRSWTRAAHGRMAQRVGSWWGNARNDLRRSGARTTEEIDIVGLAGNGAVTLVGECRWRSKAMDANVLRDLEEYKLPALRQAGYELREPVTVMLFSRAGYSASLVRAQREWRAAGRILDLVDVAAIGAGG